MRGEVRRRAGSVAHLHDGDTRLIVIGTGKQPASAEALRVAAAHAMAPGAGARDAHADVDAARDLRRGGRATGALVEGCAPGDLREEGVARAEGPPIRCPSRS